MPEFKKLTHLLDHHLHLAWVHRGQREKLPLGHGLIIELYITPAGVVHLLLARRSISPSAKEWETVMKHWPWELPSPPPKPNAFKQGKLHCLTARFPAPDVHEHWTGKGAVTAPRQEAADEN